MRILLLVTAIFAMSVTTAFADWRRTGESSAAVSYADPSSITRTGSRAKLRIMSDYHEAQTWSGFAFLSSKAEAEYDCDTPRFRILVENGYTGHMGSGTATYHVDGPRPWQPVSAGSIGEARRALACGR